MKKVLFAVVIIAILAGTVLITTAFTNKEVVNLQTLNTKLDNLTHKVDTLTTNLASTPVIRTDSYYMTAQPLGEWATAVNRPFSKGRHVSLTLDLSQGYLYPEFEQAVRVEAHIGDSGDSGGLWAEIWSGSPEMTFAPVTLDFNATDWRIRVFNGGPQAFVFRWTATMTYLP